MAHNTFKIKSILAVFVLCFLCAGHPIGAASPPASDTTAKPVTPEKDDSKGAGDQLAVQFSEEEIQAIAEALPDGEARQMFKEKVAKSEETDDASVDEAFIRWRKSIFPCAGAAAFVFHSTHIHHRYA